MADITNRRTDARLKRGALDSLLDRQRKWAGSVLRDADYSDYTRELTGNLFEPLLKDTRAELTRASGGELTRGKFPPKCHALKSSAALAINVFQYWRERDLGPLQFALEAPKRLVKMEFEAPFETGLGYPCSLDIALTANDNKSVVAIESKLTEPFEGKKDGLKPGYYLLNGEGSVWREKGLIACDLLAMQIRANQNLFSFLDAAQLLKHIFGLSRTLGTNFSLTYLWYEVGGEAGARHAEEAGRFRDAVSSEVDFQLLTYQSLVAELKKSSGNEANRLYFDYLATRYDLGV